jgi:hypothetical protein
MKPTFERSNVMKQYTRSQYLRAIMWRFGMNKKEAITTYEESVSNSHQLFLDNCIDDYRRRAIQVPVFQKRR